MLTGLGVPVKEEAGKIVVDIDPDIHETIQHLKSGKYFSEPQNNH